MVSWKTTLLPILILSIASFHFLQVGFTASWFFNRGKEVSLKLQKAAHGLADLICKKPGECKQAYDEFLEFLRDILQGALDAVANFLRNVTTSPKVQGSPYDDEIARKQRRTLINEVKGNMLKAEVVIKSFPFMIYKENRLCDLKEEIPLDQLDAIVEVIAELTNLPIGMKKAIKRTTNSTRGNIFGVDRQQSNTEGWNLVFGHIAVFRNGDTIDMAYCLYSVTYSFKNKQFKAENTGNFTTYFETLHKAHDVDNEGREDNDDDSNAAESIGLRKDFLASGHMQAEAFVKKCHYLLKTMDRKLQTVDRKRNLRF